MLSPVEYIWIDGSNPAKIRSKTRILDISFSTPITQKWSFDGSSTGQAEGHDSDLDLVPIRTYFSAFGGPLVLCEVYSKGMPHETNHRAKLNAALNNKNGLDPWFGFEQEYVMTKNNNPLGWPENGSEPEISQGPYYCGAGIWSPGREIMEEHIKFCMNYNLAIAGTNSEVMLGQWEFQIGPLPGHLQNDIAGSKALKYCDDLWVARWGLEYIAAKHGLKIDYSCKPKKGDWNGSGCHTNVSTALTRGGDGIKHIEAAIQKLSEKHSEHIQEYGVGLEERLTGHHETCDINTFKSGTAHRGASVRIPGPVAEKGNGYFEDRRPGANCDPYRVAKIIIETIG